MVLTVPPRPLLPHDLVRFAVERYSGAMPEWSHRSAEESWAVVRRTPPSLDGRVDVGLRGGQRAERAALVVHRDDIVEIVAPETLHERALAAHQHPAVAAAYASVARSDGSPLHGLAWGPTGAVGFELATGHCSVRPTSDLDLIVRAPEPVSPERAKDLLRAFAALPCRIDCILEADRGAVALAEWATSGGREVLLRTADGPVLTTAPWAPARVHAGRS